MKHQRHFDTSEAPLREAVKIRMMIGDLDRLVRLIDSNIVVQEECVGYRTERTSPIRFSRRRWQRAATISGRPSLRSNSDFQSWISLSWSPNWHKEKAAKLPRRLRHWNRRRIGGSTFLV